MRVDAILVGRNRPHDVNLVVEVSVERGPNGLDKAASTLVLGRFLLIADAYPGKFTTSFRARSRVHVTC